MPDDDGPPPNPRPRPRDAAPDTEDTDAAAEAPPPRPSRPPRPRRVGQPERFAAPSATALIEPPPIDFDDDEVWDTIPKRSSRTRRVIVGLSITVLIALIGAGLVWRWVQHQIHPPGPVGAPVEFTIESGATTSDIASDLARKKVVNNATVFRWWLSRHGGGEFKAGIYDLHEHMDYADAVAVLRGPARTATEFRVTLPPGLTVAQIKAKLLLQLQRFNASELDEAFASPEVALKWAPPTATNREGVLFPDTYNLDERTAADELGLLVRMRKETEKVATELDIENKAAALGVTPWDVIIVASLIEREAKVDADRPKIARVIYNRLAQHMKLEIDATVLYALKKDTTPLTAADLAVDSPYNTYKVQGLPPTPIATPSRRSLEAALNPADGKWLWYVLTDPSGAHTFAETEKAFLAARDVCIREKLC